MFDFIPLDQILFLDIETASGQKDFDGADEEIKDHWTQKATRLARGQQIEWADDTAAGLYRLKAAIFAEFGRIVVISVGFLYSRDGQWHLRTKSFMHEDEAALLDDFTRLLAENVHRSPGNIYLCGHNIKEFDIPYICRRLIIHGRRLPELLDMTAKKPWETPFLDTMEMWKFGDFKNYTALALLAKILQLPTPKDDISGADVSRVYWEESDVERIARYCEKDVATVAQIMLRFRGMPLISDDRMSSATFTANDGEHGNT